MYEGQQGEASYKDVVELRPGEKPAWAVTGSSIKQKDGSYLPTCEPGGTAVAPCE